MASLYKILDDAHDGQGMTALGRQFGLTPAQTEAAVTALLPAISTGLKQSTATVDGLGNLFGVMGQHVAVSPNSRPSALIPSPSCALLRISYKLAIIHAPFRRPLVGDVTFFTSALLVERGEVAGCDGAADHRRSEVVGRWTSRSYILHRFFSALKMAVAALTLS